MSWNSSVYFVVLWISLQLLAEVNCQLPFKPSVQSGHTATLVDNKLYILGGLVTGKEFFFLDVSVPFDTKELSWQDLSNINIVPAHNIATSVKGGANNDTLILFGGDNIESTISVMSLVYTFDPKTNSWNTPQITGVGTVQTSGLTGII